MKDLATLKAAIVAALSDPSLRPENGVTHCNQGAIKIGNSLGCHELDGLCADEQYAVMVENKSRKWSKVFGSAAALWAQSGGLAYAAMTSKMLTERAAAASVKAGLPIPEPDPHGHIDALYPEPMQMSGSLGHPVPMVCNIGRQNTDEKESAAFPVACGEADYFIWLG